METSNTHEPHGGAGPSAQQPSLNQNPTDQHDTHNSRQVYRRCSSEVFADTSIILPLLDLTISIDTDDEAKPVEVSQRVFIHMRSSYRFSPTPSDAYAGLLNSFLMSWQTLARDNGSASPEFMEVFNWAWSTEMDEASQQLLSSIPDGTLPREHLESAMHVCRGFGKIQQEAAGRVGVLLFTQNPSNPLDVTASQIDAWCTDRCSMALPILWNGRSGPGCRFWGLDVLPPLLSWIRPDLDVPEQWSPLEDKGHEGRKGS